MAHVTFPYKDLYCQSHQEVGVMFACIPDYETYSEEFKTTEECIACLRLLNELFSGIILKL